jgi:hypothetical protein
MRVKLDDKTPLQAESNRLTALGKTRGNVAQAKKVFERSGAALPSTLASSHETRPTRFRANRT